MFNVRLAGGHLYGKQLFNWLSLVVSFMASFVLSCFPLDVLDGIWDLIESVSEGFLTYFCQLRSGQGKPGRVAQSVGHLTRKSGVLGSIPGLATEGQLSVTGESMCTKYWLTAPPTKSVVRLTDHPDMTLDVYRGR